MPMKTAFSDFSDTWPAPHTEAASACTEIGADHDDRRGASYGVFVWPLVSLVVILALAAIAVFR